MQGKKRFCIFGLRVTGDAGSLDKASAALTGAGYDAKVTQIIDGFMVVKSDGKSLTVLKTANDRINTAEFGVLKSSVLAVPVAGQK
jgi:hypothetical protein